MELKVSQNKVKNIILEARKYALTEIEKFGVPSHLQFEISEKKALKLAERLQADKDIVLLGVYLMDLKLGQAFKEGKLSEHIKMSSGVAKEFLNKFEIGKEIKEKVINCVEAHHATVPFNSIEAEICANADCYKFIHPKGFFACLTFFGKRYSDFFDCLNQAEKKMDEKYNILSLDICKKELDGYYKVLKKFIKEARKI